MEANNDGRKHVIAGFLREVWSGGMRRRVTATWHRSGDEEAPQASALGHHRYSRLRVHRPVRDAASRQGCGAVAVVHTCVGLQLSGPRGFYPE
jgi:hypothetical protein